MQTSILCFLLLITLVLAMPFLNHSDELMNSGASTMEFTDQVTGPTTEETDSITNTADSKQNVIEEEVDVQTDERQATEPLEGLPPGTNPEEEEQGSIVQGGDLEEGQKEVEEPLIVAETFIPLENTTETVHREAIETTTTVTPIESLDEQGGDEVISEAPLDKAETPETEVLQETTNESMLETEDLGYATSGALQNVTDEPTSQTGPQEPVTEVLETETEKTIDQGESTSAVEDSSIATTGVNSTVPIEQDELQEFSALDVGVKPQGEELNEAETGEEVTETLDSETTQTKSFGPIDSSTITGEVTPQLQSDEASYDEAHSTNEATEVAKPTEFTDPEDGGSKIQVSASRVSNTEDTTQDTRDLVNHEGGVTTPETGEGPDPVVFKTSSSTMVTETYDSGSTEYGTGVEGTGLFGVNRK